MSIREVEGHELRSFEKLGEYGQTNRSILGEESEIDEFRDVQLSIRKGKRNVSAMLLMEAYITCFHCILSKLGYGEEQRWVRLYSYVSART